MATEIELKAHVKDSGALKILLAERAEYLGSFEKEDVYWFPGGDSARLFPGLPHSGIRIRREKHVLPGGSEKSSCMATWKRKQVRDGIEINDEREFELKPGGVFEELLAVLGFNPGAAKRKRGWAFSQNGTGAELLEVEGLGWFIELEILADNSREETLAEGRRRLLEFLADLGIERNAVESRYYTAMLKEAAAPSV